MKVAQSCLTLRGPWTIPSMEFSRLEYWSGSLSLLQGIPNPELEPRSPALQANSLPAEPQGKPKNSRALEWVAYPFSSRSSRCRNGTGVSCIAGRFFTNWAIGEYQLIFSIYRNKMMVNGTKFCTMTRISESSLSVKSMGLCVCVCVCYFLSHIWLFVTPWTVACQDSMSMGIPRQEYWSGLSCLSPGDLPDSAGRT